MSRVNPNGKSKIADSQADGLAIATLVTVVVLAIGFIVYAAISGSTITEINQKLPLVPILPTNQSACSIAGETRRTQAYQKRVNVAYSNYVPAVPCHPNNGDETLYASSNYFASFSKGLQHNSIGHVLPGSYQLFKKAAQSQIPSGITLFFIVKQRNITIFFFERLGCSASCRRSDKKIDESTSWKCICFGWWR